MAESVVREKSYAFALDMIRVAGRLVARREYVIARQLLRSGTSVGANIEEAQAGQSRRDFRAKMAIAAKEARESHYWLRLIRDSGLLSENITPKIAQAEELIRLLTAIVKTSGERRD